LSGVSGVLFGMSVGLVNVIVQYCYLVLSFSQSQSQSQSPEALF